MKRPLRNHLIFSCGMRMAILLASVIAPCFTQPGFAGTEGEEFPEFEFRGILDLRYMHPDGAGNWTTGNLGKLSYGNGQANSNLFSLNQAALLIRSRFDWSWSGSLTAKYSDRQENPLDISEAIILFKPVSTSPLRFSGRLGAFFPPVSMENSGVAWTSPYTLSSSAINSWVGEELKVFGGEAQLNYQTDSGDRIGVFAAGFGNNDTAGVLLAWRGWSLDDYSATINDSFPITPEVAQSGLFPKQAASTRPFAEIDGRPGFYAGVSLERPESGKLRAIYYDNRGNPGIVKNGQYAWHTRFASLSLKMDLAWETELIAQGMLGNTQMGNVIGGQYTVDTSFRAESVLLSKKLGIHRLSVRYDNFGTSENDYLPQDPNSESGDAWTCNYNISLPGQQQINFEVSSIDSNRASRQILGQTARQTQTLWQVAYRWFF